MEDSWLQNISEEKCVLVKFNNYSENQVSLGYQSWLKTETDDLDSILEDSLPEKIYQIYWPYLINEDGDDTRLRNALSLREMMKIKDMISFKVECISILDYGDWVTINQQKKNYLEGKSLSKDKKDRHSKKIKRLNSFETPESILEKKCNAKKIKIDDNSQNMDEKNYNDKIQNMLENNKESNQSNESQREDLYKVDSDSDSVSSFESKNELEQDFDTKEEESENENCKNNWSEEQNFENKKNNYEKINGLQSKIQILEQELKDLKISSNKELEKNVELIKNLELKNDSLKLKISDLSIKNENLTSKNTMLIKKIDELNEKCSNEYLEILEKKCKKLTSDNRLYVESYNLLIETQKKNFAEIQAIASRGIDCCITKEIIKSSPNSNSESLVIKEQNTLDVITPNSSLVSDIPNDAEDTPEKKCKVKAVKKENIIDESKALVVKTRPSVNDKKLQNGTYDVGKKGICYINYQSYKSLLYSKCIEKIVPFLIKEVFSHEELKQGSLSGQVNNAQKKNNPAIKPKKPLNPLKVECIQEEVYDIIGYSRPTRKYIRNEISQKCYDAGKKKEIA